ncbi:MAG: T9SS type A sorting domain-containing protein [Hymenobacteraceae bacterium]|nr:T9SS type A sorting domain-containing protein [Hymenobacteraceae bacterium]
MNIPSTLHQLWQLLLALLLGMLPLFDLMAQAGEPKDKKVITIKIKRDENGKVQLIDTTITIPDGVRVREALAGIVQDTAISSRLRDLRLHVLSDSLRFKSLRPAEFARSGDTIRFNSATAETIYRSGEGSDSVRVFSFKKPDEGALSDIKAVGIESITVIKGKNRVNIDSLLAAHPDAVTFKVKTDEQTRERQLIRIDADGREKVLREGRMPASVNENAFIIIKRKVDIQDMGAEDKQALKELGAPVETKAKEELAVEQIQFYPNPNNGRFRVSFTLGNIGTTVVRVMDSKGEEVFVDTVEKLSGEYSREINLMPFGPGIYYLQVAQGKKYHTRRIMVQ